MPAPSTAPLRNTLDKSYAINSKARVIAEWNMNRYAEVVVADNFFFPDDSYNEWPGINPISSIVEPNRPTSGLPVFIPDVSNVFDTAQSDAQYGIPKGTTKVPVPFREYVADETNKYKYWVSHNISGTTPAPTGGYAITTQYPYVKYGTTNGSGQQVYANVNANKLVITFEISQCKPMTTAIYLRTNGVGVVFDNSWGATPIAQNVTINSKGQAILYYQGGGTWSESPGVYLDAPSCQLSSIAVEVDTLSAASSYLSVIEISPRLERDISNRVIDFDTGYNLGEDDQISPVGTISANTGNVSISNIIDGVSYPGQGLFETSSLYGPQDANVKFTFDIGVDTSGYSGAGYEYTRIATMYSDSWNRSEDTMNVSLKDSSKFLQEVNPNASLFQDTTIGVAIGEILDSVGFNNWEYNVAPGAANLVIAYYWTNPEETVWRNIQDLCRGTQSVAYIDEDGVFQITTRDAAFLALTDPLQIPELRSDIVVDKLPNIEDISFGTQFQVNAVTINYRPTALAADALGNPLSEIVWQPDDTVVLRQSSLKTAITAASTTFWMDQKDALLWPYEGQVNIQGELIKYYGKHYYYINKAGQWAGAAVFNDDQKRSLDNISTSSADAGWGLSWRNYFSGLFYITERGVGPTSPMSHDAFINGWFTNGAWIGLAGSASTKWNGGLKYDNVNSFLRLQTNKNFSNSHSYCALRSTPTYATPDTVYGTRMRFPSSPSGFYFNTGGIFLYANSAMTDMYMIDIATTSTIEIGNYRAKSNEIRIMKRQGSSFSQLNKGSVFGVSKDQWIDLDVRVDSNYNISVSINGRVVLSATDPTARIAASNRCGLFVRGFTVADFENFYAVPGGHVLNLMPDETDFLSQIGGGYQSKQLPDYVMGYFGPTNKKGSSTTGIGVPAGERWKSVGPSIKNSYKDRYIEEFGCPIHEVREYNVKFDKGPVLYSSLYVSNSDQIVTPEYIGNPWGADFTIANSSRINSVVSGEDTLTYGTDNPVEQKMVIYGRTIQQQDEKAYIVKDDIAIRARGEVALELSSPWIQSVAAAKAIGDWIVSHWAKPADTVEMTVFGNPLIRVGDTVSITHAPKGLNAVKFIVLSNKQSWDNGLTTSLICRKAPS